MALSTHIYQLKNVMKSYTKGGEKLSILKGLDLSIETGEIVSIMGPSGTGKSTLFNILGGLDSADSGEVLFMNRDLQDLNSRTIDHWRGRQVGFIFQFYHLIPVLTTYQNVEIPLLLTSLSRKERKRKIDAALSLVELEDRHKHYPNQLSGGQQQRVAIARAIVTDPSVILADELTGDLDAKTSEEIAKIVTVLNRDFQKTFILFTHDLRIAQLGKRMLSLEGGQIVPLKLEEEEGQ